MKEKQYREAVVVGRFRPFHHGHKKLVDIALERAEHVTLVIGSLAPVRTVKNIFLVPEVSEMIRSVYPNRNQVSITSVFDMPDQDGAWAKSVMLAVLSYASSTQALLIGCQKDYSSHYLSLFPCWDLEIVEVHKHLNATDIRADYFAGNKINEDLCPLEVCNYLERFRLMEGYNECLKTRADLKVSA